MLEPLKALERGNIRQVLRACGGPFVLEQIAETDDVTSDTASEVSLNRGWPRIFEADSADRG